MESSIVANILFPMRAAAVIKITDSVGNAHFWYKNQLDSKYFTILGHNVFREFNCMNLEIRIILKKKTTKIIIKNYITYNYKSIQLNLIK